MGRPPAPSRAPIPRRRRPCLARRRRSNDGGRTIGDGDETPRAIDDSPRRDSDIGGRRDGHPARAGEHERGCWLRSGRPPVQPRGPVLLRHLPRGARQEIVPGSWRRLVHRAPRRFLRARSRPGSELQPDDGLFVLHDDRRRPFLRSRRIGVLSNDRNLRPRSRLRRRRRLRRHARCVRRLSGRRQRPHVLHSALRK